MRKLISVMLCLALIAGFAACTGRVTPTIEDNTAVPIGTIAGQTDVPGPADTEAPDTDIPDTEAPDTDIPDTDIPETTDPAVTDYITDAPATAAPTSPATSGPTPKPTAAPNVETHPYPTDPTEIRYAEAGKTLMRKLMAMPEYASLNINARRGYPYMIAINTAQYKCTVTVYCVDENGQYTRPYLSIVCSTGREANNLATPLGIFNTRARYSWHTLAGPCYGQYCTRITGSVLFHSVPYYCIEPPEGDALPHKYNLEYYQYNRLGRQASMGCVRLPCSDAKWIYDNCPVGTQVVIYSDSSSAGPMGQPTPLRLDVNDTFMRGWDPTDPDRYNPWGDQYKAGYTIRSQIAQADYEYAMAHHLWDGTINRPEQPTPTPDVSPTATPSPTPSPTPEATPTPTPTPEVTPTPTPSIPTVPPTEEPTPVPTGRPTPTPTAEPTPTAAPAPGPDPTEAPTEPPEAMPNPIMRARRMAV